MQNSVDSGMGIVQKRIEVQKGIFVVTRRLLISKRGTVNSGPTAMQVPGLALFPGLIMAAQTLKT